MDTPAGSEEITYDALVLAPGAVASRPPIGGLDKSTRVRTLRTVDDAVALRTSVETGARRAVVLGAGFIGLEAAEALPIKGRQQASSSSPHVLPPLENEMAALVTDELAQLGIAVYTGVSAQIIESNTDQDTVVLSDGTRLEADVVVLSTGVRPDTAAS